MADHRAGEARVRLEISASPARCMAQVDCQHRLGHLADLPIALPFMCFIGLSEREEMEVFSVINSKAKGLSTSLLDFHDAQLAATSQPRATRALHRAASEQRRQTRRGIASSTSAARRPPAWSAARRCARCRRRSRVFLKRHEALARRIRGGRAQVVLDFWCGAVGRAPDQWSESPQAHADQRRRRLCADGHRRRPLSRGRDGGRGLRPAVSRQRASADFAGEFDWSTDWPAEGIWRAGRRQGRCRTSSARPGSSPIQGRPNG